MHADNPCCSPPQAFMLLLSNTTLFPFPSTSETLNNICYHYYKGNGTPLQYSCLENPWTEEPGRLQSMGSLRVGTTERLHFHFSLSCIGEGNGNPLQCSCLENPMDGGAWWAAVYGVAQSWTQLKRLSSSSSSILMTFKG